MVTSSTPRASSAASDTDVQTGPNPRAYRNRRRHLYQADQLQRAHDEGGAVSTFCGLAHVVEPDQQKVNARPAPKVDDCVTCVDVWKRRPVVRL